MKHLKKFENFGQSNKDQCTQIISINDFDTYSKEFETISNEVNEKSDILTKNGTIDKLISQSSNKKELEKSTGFEEILSGSYNEESISISNEDLLSEVDRLERLRGSIGVKLRQMGVHFDVKKVYGENKSYPIHKLDERNFSNDRGVSGEISKLLETYFKSDYDSRILVRKYQERISKD